MSQEQYVKIAYEFRLPHHVYPSYFSKWGILLAFIFAPVSLWYFYKRSTLVFMFILALFIGDLICLVGIYINNYWILTTWWMRMDAWNRFFGCIGLIGMVEVFIKQRNLSQQWVIGILFFATVIGSLYKFSATHYDFLPHQKVDAERDICLKANQLLPLTANCVTPFHFTALPYYGKVSSYVCFKAIPKRADYLYSWYNRLNEVYKIDTNQIEKGFSLVPIANENFKKLNLNELLRLKGEGVTHIITYSEVKYPTLRLLTRNKEYAIYKI